MHGLTGASLASTVLQAAAGLQSSAVPCKRLAISKTAVWLPCSAVGGAAEEGSGQQGQEGQGRQGEHDTCMQLCSASLHPWAVQGSLYA